MGVESLDRWQHLEQFNIKLATSHGVVHFEAPNYARMVDFMLSQHNVKQLSLNCLGVGPKSHSKRRPRQSWARIPPESVRQFHKKNAVSQPNASRS